MKLIKNKPLSIVMRIAVVLIADTILQYVILPRDFLRFDKQENGYFLELVFGTKMLWPTEPLTFSKWFQIAWNQNVRSLIIFLFIVGMLIILLLRFRYKRVENFQLSRHTVIIALVCLFFSAIGYSRMIYSAYLQGTLIWQYEITNMLRVIFVVALFEELIYRGFITNELFHLKQYGLRIPVAIVISATIFGLLHLRFAIYGFIQGDSIAVFDMAEKMFSPTITGISWAIILYYRKDIISLICIHAAHNLLTHTYMSESILTVVLYWAFYGLFIIGYPVYLTVNERKKRKALSVV